VAAAAADAADAAQRASAVDAAIAAAVADDAAPTEDLLAVRVAAGTHLHASLGVPISTVSVASLKPLMLRRAKDAYVNLRRERVGPCFTVRARPLVAKERLERARECLSYPGDGKSVILGKNRVFQFDDVFHPAVEQSTLYTDFVAPLVESCFNGGVVQVEAGWNPC
jgi:hypothetical protein